MIKRFVGFKQYFICVTLFLISNSSQAYAIDIDSFAEEYLKAWKTFVTSDRTDKRLDEYNSTVKDLVRKTSTEVVLQHAEELAENVINKPDDPTLQIGLLRLNPYFFLILKLREVKQSGPSDKIVNANQLLANLYVITFSDCKDEDFFKDFSNEESLKMLNEGKVSPEIHNPECKAIIRKQVKGAGTVLTVAVIKSLIKFANASEKNGENDIWIQYVKMMTFLRIGLLLNSLGR